MQQARRQQGFTLIEIAIVLVIIGLLLGGVLKGQEMIENGKIKNAINDFNGIAAAVNGYRDRYRAIPGDDPGAAARGWNPAQTAGGGNGQIGAPLANPFTTNGENVNAWRHLRAAQLITGNPATATVATGALPQHAFGGPTGFTLGVLGINATTVVCMQNIPGKAALALDNQMDDGVPNNGQVRTMGSSAANPSPPPVALSDSGAAYDENRNYTVCRGI